MSVSVLTLAIDNEEIRKPNRNRRCYGAWTVFAFLGTRNEPGKGLARERQVIITTKIIQPGGSLMN